MAEVTRAITEAAERGPAPVPAPMRILTPWVAPAPGGGSALTLPNRAVMAPMRTGTAEGDGRPSVDTIAWYVARARGGTGLIVVEPTFVVPVDLPNIARPLVLAGAHNRSSFAKLAALIRDGGAVPAISLDHPDRNPMETWTRNDIHAAIAAFRAGATAAKDAGFAALHLSLDTSGFLGRSLLRTCNRRTDAFGRGPNGRLRLAREVVAAVASAELPVIVRVACPAQPVGSPAIDAASSVAAALVESGATVIEVAPGPRFDDKRLPLLAGNGEAVLAIQVGAIAAHLRAAGHAVPIVASGRIASPPGAEAALSVSGVEAVAIGRALIADPAWLAKVRNGVESEIVPCIGCMACFNLDGSGAHGEYRIGCVTNSDAGHEADSMQGTSSPRRVTVLGSGLPGLEFARIAASRGHHVTIVPDENPLGGITGLRSGIPGNAEYGRAALWSFDQLRELGVVVAGRAPSGSEVTVDARPPMPLAVAWASGRNVLRAAEVLGRDLHQMYGIGRRVAVCGPGALAAEVALFLAGWGRRPTVVVPGSADDPFPDVHPMHGAQLWERLQGYRCELVTGAIPLRWLDSRDRKSRLVVRQAGHEIELGPFQTAVDCEGWHLPQMAGASGPVLGDAALAPDLLRLVRYARQAAQMV